jgi:hypothetical protein
MWRKEEDVTFPDHDVIKLAAIVNLEDHIALELVKELLDRIVVIVRTLVRSTDNEHHHVGVLPDLLIAYRRLQQMAMVIDPLLKIEC